MRRMVCIALVLAASGAAGQDKVPPRYNIEADVDRLPQKTPQDTLRSLLKTIESKRVDYALAHLADPAFVDQRVKDVGGRFEVMVQETTRKLDADPQAIRELRKFLTDGEWQDQGDAASAKCPDVRGKMVYFRKIGNRWYFENRTSPAKDQ